MRTCARTGSQAHGQIMRTPGRGPQQQPPPPPRGSCHGGSTVQQPSRPLMRRDDCVLRWVHHSRGSGGTTQATTSNKLAPARRALCSARGARAAADGPRAGAHARATWTRPDAGSACCPPRVCVHKNTPADGPGLLDDKGPQKRGLRQRDTHGPDTCPRAPGDS